MKNNRTEIPITFRTLAHLYDPDDPSPEDERELADRAEELIGREILDSPDPLGAKERYCLEIHISPSDFSDDRARDIPAAIRAHFLRRAKEIHQDARLIRRIGLREVRLTAGVCIPAFLGIMIIDRLPHDSLLLVIQNVLVIFSWVVIWQPFQSLVFDRWTLSTKEKVYRQIAGMEMRVISSRSKT
jgi:hypothetical protein